MPDLASTLPALDAYYADVLAGRARFKIVCVGLNYVDHAKEAKQEIPPEPLLFAKWTNAVVGSEADIVVPAGVEQVDYEAELAVVVGRRASRLTADRALDAVAGYTCLNDVSSRALQFGDGQWTRGKSVDTFCPVGPRIVPASEIADPQAVRVACRVNGETRQDGTTADMIFGVGEILAHVTQTITLEAGDIVATGTPPGVALGEENPRWLTDGDVVEVEVTGIGVLRNRVVSAR